MRIIAGEWRGRRLVAPAGEATRPTSDRTRETLFSMLTSRLGGFTDLAVADLFAGSGALGLEALSRGAAAATFVDKDPAALATIERNVATLGAGARSRVLRGSVEAMRATAPIDLLFIDPPYGEREPAVILDALRTHGWIAPGAWVAYETAKRAGFTADGFAVEAERDVGAARLTLLIAQ